MKMKKLCTDLAFIWQFSVDDFKNKYSNSLLGIGWAFLQPMITILIYWFVFQLGFKSQPVENFPFILWLISGLIPWFFMSEAIPGSTSVLAEYSYLVQKVLFNINILPLVKLISTLFVQFFLTILMIIMFWLFGYSPDLCYVQIIYYMAYMLLLTAGISYITAALFIFLRDLNQIVAIILQIAFWFTPIVWDIKSMSESIQKIMQFNPVYFIIRGYRKTFVYKEMFWINEPLSIFYWTFAFLLLFVGIKLFRKLKPHFADVL